jgi:hypothetical protein
MECGGHELAQKYMRWRQYPRLVQQIGKTDIAPANPRVALRRHHDQWIVK